MTHSETKYQRYLARKRQKQGNKTHGTKWGHASWMARQIHLAANSPVHECLVPAGLFEKGIGNLIFSRALGDGRIASSFFLLDVFCLGVKNAFFTLARRDEYGRRLQAFPPMESLQPVHPGCFRRLVEGAVAYAHNLGLEPHSDYAWAHLLFGNLEVGNCPEHHFEYGHEGKPFYISGPHETPAQVQATLDQLERRLGPENFHFLVGGPL